MSTTTKIDIAQVRTDLGLRTLSPREIKALRQSWGLSQREFGELIGLASNSPDVTVRKWEAGDRVISEPTANLLILIERELSSRHA